MPAKASCDRATRRSDPPCTDRLVTVGETAALDGRGSVRAEAFSWTFDARPAGSAAALTPTAALALDGLHLSDDGVVLAALPVPDGVDVTRLALMHEVRPGDVTGSYLV